jgi:ubiquinone/menaquinone biosynthesis C-methylase UbiE
MVDTTFGGSIPEYYDSILGPAQLDAFAADLARRVPVRPKGDVLELACGTGLVTRRLRERLDPRLRLVATDISEPMLAYARGKVKGAIDWRVADAAALPMRDAEFGAVVCAFGVMFVPDKPKLFAEARRVLAEGGMLFFNCWNRIEMNAHGRIARRVIDELFPGDPEMQFTQVPFSFHDEALIRRLLGEARFGEVRIDKVTLPIACPSARTYATGQIRGTPRGSLIEKKGRTVDEVIDRLAAELAKEGGAEPFRADAHALVVQTKAV